MPPEIDFYNPRSILLFICILQGVVFAGLLGVRGFRKSDKSDYWLALLLLVMCSSLITSFIGFANVYDNYQFLSFFPFELVFAHAPIIFLYVKSLTDASRSTTRKDLLLFLPAAVHWLFYFAVFIQAEEFKKRYGLSFGAYFGLIGRDLLLIIWNAVLLYMSIRYYRKYRVWIDDNYSDTDRIKFDWLRNFLYLFTGVFVVATIFEFIDFIFDLSYIQTYYFELLIAVATYYLGVAGYLRTDSIEVEFKPGRKTETPDKGEDELASLMSRLTEMMGVEKPYLDPQLTLKALSKKAGVNKSRLSQTINKGFGKNFNDFINEYRIDEIKKKLSTPAFERSTLLEVALDCGFNSKATFNRSFKKFTGVTPAEYLKQGADT